MRPTHHRASSAAGGRFQAAPVTSPQGFLLLLCDWSLGHGADGVDHVCGDADRKLNSSVPPPLWWARKTVACIHVAQQCSSTSYFFSASAIPCWTNRLGQKHTTSKFWNPNRVCVCVFLPKETFDFIIWMLCNFLFCSPTLVYGNEKQFDSTKWINEQDDGREMRKQCWQRSSQTNHWSVAKMLFNTSVHRNNSSIKSPMMAGRREARVVHSYKIHLLDWAWIFSFNVKWSVHSNRSVDYWFTCLKPRWPCVHARQKDRKEPRSSILRTRHLFWPSGLDRNWKTGLVGIVHRQPGIRCRMTWSSMEMPQNVIW